MRAVDLFAGLGGSTSGGFPPDYALPPDRRLATHLLGNAVCPPVMREIVGVLMARA